MEPNQVNLFAAAVSGDLQQIIYALEPGFMSQIICDFADGDLRNRIHDNVALLHPVTAAHSYTWMFPDANAASDSPVPDSVTNTFREHHMNFT